jgi:hypothetical protein
VENSASRSAQALNTQQAAPNVQARGSATPGNNYKNDDNRNYNLSGSNSYGANAGGPSGAVSGGAVSGSNTALNGGTQSAMADNLANGYNAQQGGGGNSNSYYAQSPARSANTLNLAGVQSSASPTITYEVDASPAQLAALIKNIRQEREFSSPELPVALEQELRQAGSFAGNGRGFGGGGYRGQFDVQAANGPAAAPTDPAKGAPAQFSRGKEGQSDAEAHWSDKTPDHDASAKSQSVAPVAGPAQTRPVPPLANQQFANQQPAIQQAAPTTTGKTRVVFVLNVVDRIASPPLAPAPMPAMPAAPAAPLPASPLPGKGN